MYIKNGKRQRERFLVLVPHQDVRVALRKYSDSLVKTGLNGVYSFPWVVPLASLSRALTPDELKQITCSLRQDIGGVKICVGDTAATEFTTDEKDGSLSLFGPKIDLGISRSTFSCDLINNPLTQKKIKKTFNPLVIGTWLVPKTSEQQFCDFCAVNQRFDVPLREKLSFRAAAVANMYWQSVQVDGETGYKWKIGKLCWLPRSLHP